MSRTKTVATALAAALLVACASGRPPSPETCDPKGTSVNVVASGGQFDAACVAVPADQPFTVTFSNEDLRGHNFTVRDGGEPVFAVFAGPQGTSTEEGAPLTAGTYEFLCTIHPAMEGTFIAASPQDAS